MSNETDVVRLAVLGAGAGSRRRALRVGFKLRNIEAHIRPRGEAPLVGRYKGKPRRCVVGRTNGWHNRFRAPLVSWERKSEHYVALCQLANALIAFRTSIS